MKEVEVGGVCGWHVVEEKWLWNCRW